MKSNDVLHSHDIGHLLHRVPENVRKLFRKYESLSKKSIKKKWSNTFNSVCLRENIMPVYTKIRHHDPALANDKCTKEYQRSLIQREIKQNDRTLCRLSEELEDVKYALDQCNLDSELRNKVFNTLQDILQNSDRIQKCIVLKKLNKLYNGEIMLKGETSCFINLSDHILSQAEKDFLNLGLNFHIQPKYNKLHKQTEIEALYGSLLELQKNKKITINPRLADQLASESTKHRNPYYRCSLSSDLKNAAKELKNNDKLVIRKADKSSTYVILNKKDYLDKINELLDDTSKFKHITKNPTDELKQKANALISSLNAAQDNIHLQKIIGDYSPGYIYGNVKIHKDGNPLRPIISQVPTPTYHLAKSLNKIITPYIPNTHTIKSTDEFVDLLHSSNCKGIIASLDVESLFTNVPLDDTIDIIIQCTYHHPTIPPPKMPAKILKSLLELCTRGAPFTAPDGKMYLQVEGVAMGSPLGPTFANFYMGNLENKVFDKIDKPSIYVRYVDDCFLQIDNEKQLDILKYHFEKNSVLKFTYELSVDKKLPFLDVLVESTQNKFGTTVYHKPTNLGNCLNADSECVDRYKDSVVKNYLNRAYKVSQNWHDFNREVEYIKQILINNNYSNIKVDTLIRKFLEKKQTCKENATARPNIIPIFYNSQMHRNYRLDERVLREILKTNIKCNDENGKVQMTFYHKNIKSANLVMRNNMAARLQPLRQASVVYEFICPFPHSKVEKYIGMTQTTLSRRLMYHTQSGSIFNHFKADHDCKPSRETLANNTKIIAKAENRYKLAIKEAILIVENIPTINKQFDNFVNILRLNNRRCTNIEPIEPSLDLNITSLTEPHSSQDHIPDMVEILKKFGINSEELVDVPLCEYKWWEFNHCPQHKDDTLWNTLTISQRIKSLKRKTKTKKSYV